DVVEPQVAQISPRIVHERGDALDGIDLLREPREDRRLVAAAGTHLEHLRPRFLEQELRHVRDDRRARDGLSLADRQGDVLVRARGDALLHEAVARNLHHRREHALVRDAVLAQRLHHAQARALRRHPDSVGRAHCRIQSDTSGICVACVRSTCSGVTETAPRSSAWKSVPGPASRAGPAAPTQYTVSPRGFLPGTTGWALWRRPRRVTSTPVRLSKGTSGTFTLRSTGA